jgi:glycosyltransferase involved in cell wall biosynthesis
VKRVGILQNGGTFERLAATPDDKSLETYFAQQETIRSIDALGRSHGHCTLISIRSPHPYSVDVSSASTAVGLGLDPHRQAGDVLDRVAALELTHLLVQIPSPSLITGVQRQGNLRLAAALADSFHQPGVRALRYKRKLIAALNGPRVEFVANHGPNATRHLLELGVRGKPVIPFDFEYPYSPADAPVKQDASAFGHRLLYVGTVSHDKGVFDLVAAMTTVARTMPAARLTVIGDGPDLDELRALVARLGLGANVDLAGRQSHDTVLERLRDSAVSIVPSRHCYGEGLPLTIYEALATRTPLVTSDHPMLAQRVIDGLTGLVVHEKDPEALGRAIVRALTDDGLYRRLSDNATFGWELLKGSLSFWPMVDDWLNDRIVGGRSC